MIEKPKLVAPDEQAPGSGLPNNDKVSIIKPGTFSLDKFKSKHAAALANVETLLTAFARPR